MAKLTPWIRAAFVAGLGLYLLGVLLQTTLAGWALFASPGEDFEPHRLMGYLVHLGGIGVVPLGLLSRPGRPLLWWIIGFGVVVFFQPLLPVLRVDMPYVAALHPVMAIVAFWLGWRIWSETSGWLTKFGQAES